MTRSSGQEQWTRRLEATLGVLAEAASAPGRDEPVIAIRSFGAGRLALAVAGAVDAGVVERLGTLLDEHLVRELSACELVIDLSEVRTCGPGLARLLDRVRSRRIVEGCRVELCNPSEALVAGLAGRGSATSSHWRPSEPGRHPAAQRRRRRGPPRRRALSVREEGVATLMAGHNLICERSDTLDELPARVATMWAGLLPLIATEDRLAQHRTRG